VEVNRPDRLARRLDGKIDRLDAEQIARAVLGQTSTANPRAKSGSAEVTAPGPRSGEAIPLGGRELLQVGPAKRATLKAGQDRVALRL
jgi:hypothetical protein